MTPAMPWRRGSLALLTSLLFAGSFIAGKYTSLELGPLTTALLRYVIASGALAVGVMGKPSAHRPRGRADWLPIGLLGTLGILGYHGFFFASLRYTAVANTAILNAFNPVVTGVLAAACLGERLSPRQYGGTAIALSGVMILLTQGQPWRLLALRLNLGDGLMLCAVLCWALYTLLIKHLSQRYGGLTLTFWSAITGVVQLAIAAAFTEQWWQQVGHLSLTTWLALAYMGIAVSGVGYLLFNLSVEQLGPTRTASVVYSGVPIFVAILAWIFLQQPVTLVMVLSMVGVLLGLRLVLIPQRAKKSTNSAQSG